MNHLLFSALKYIESMHCPPGKEHETIMRMGYTQIGSSNYFETKKRVAFADQGTLIISKKKV